MSFTIATETGYLRSITVIRVAFGGALTRAFGTSLAVICVYTCIKEKEKGDSTLGITLSNDTSEGNLILLVGQWGRMGQNVIISCNFLSLRKNTIGVQVTWVDRSDECMSGLKK